MRVSLLLLLLSGCAHVGAYEPRAGGGECRPVRAFPWVSVDRYECRRVMAR